MTGVPIPPNYPVVGRDAFRTATGVHAAAVIKAFRKQDHELVDAVYSGVPASLVGREQEIEVGPMSGKSNVVFWLEKRGLPVTDDVVDRIFAKAKASASVLLEDEILQELQSIRIQTECLSAARAALRHSIDSTASGPSPRCRRAPRRRRRRRLQRRGATACRACRRRGARRGSRGR